MSVGEKPSRRPAFDLARNVADAEFLELGDVIVESAGTVTEQLGDGGEAVLGVGQHASEPLPTHAALYGAFTSPLSYAAMTS